MATIKKQHSLKIDGDGFVQARLTVTETTQTITIGNGGKSKRSLMIDEKTRDEEVILYEFQCETTTKDEFKPVNSMVFNLSLSGEIKEKKRIGKKMINIYNKFTQTLVMLNIIDEETLKKYREGKDDIDADTVLAELLAIKDLPVRLKLMKNPKGFFEPDWLTVEVVGDMPTSDDS